MKISSPTKFSVENGRMDDLAILTKGDFKVVFSETGTEWHADQGVNDMHVRMSCDGGKTWFFKFQFGTYKDRIFECSVTDDQAAENEESELFTFAIPSEVSDAEYAAMKKAQISLFSEIESATQAVNGMKANVPNFSYKFEGETASTGRSLKISVGQELPAGSAKVLAVINYSGNVTGANAANALGAPRMIYSSYAAIAPNTSYHTDEFGDVGVLSVGGEDVCIPDLHYATSIKLKIVPVAAANENPPSGLVRLKFEWGSMSETRTFNVAYDRDDEKTAWHTFTFSGRTINGNLFVSRLECEETNSLDCDCYIVDVVADTIM